jgi:hypothetical protein
MYDPNNVWQSTPNKIDHLKPGYTSKVIFLYNRVATGLGIADTQDIFQTIQGAANNFKGDARLPNGYFNKYSGQSFKITLHFYKKLDHQDVYLTAGLYDSDADVLYDVVSNTGPTSGSGSLTLVKYEFIITKMYDGHNDAILTNGSITYSNMPDGSGLFMIPISGSAILPDGVTPSYSFQIINNCGDYIAVTHLMVEEIS